MMNFSYFLGAIRGQEKVDQSLKVFLSKFQNNAAGNLKMSVRFGVHVMKYATLKNKNNYLNKLEHVAKMF
jgi:hypothetical protein